MVCKYVILILRSVSEVFTVETVKDNVDGNVELCLSVEKMMYSAGYTHTQDLGGSYIGPEINAMLRIQISELERPDFLYVNMFGQEMNREVLPSLVFIYKAIS